jgi:hypothetical protein
MALISVQYQQIPPGENERLGAIPWVMAINPGAGASPFPGRNVLGRMQRDDEASFIRRGAEGGRDYARLLAAWYRERPYLAALTVLNEPELAGEDGELLSVFMVACVRELRDLGVLVPLILFNVGMGKPELDEVQYLAAALREPGTILGLHEYSAPTMQTGVGWYCLRYQHTLLELERLGVKSEVWITEAGIDRGGGRGDPPVGTGWRTFCLDDEERFWQQILWYEGRLRSDPRVSKVFLFVRGPWEGRSGWGSFKITDGLVERAVILHRIRLQEELPPAPAPAPSPSPAPAPAPSPVDTASAAILATLWEETARTLIPLNPEAALRRVGAQHGVVPCSHEVYFAGWVAQQYFDPNDDRQRFLLYCPEGHWDEIHFDACDN